MAVVNTYIPQPTQLMFETEEGQRMASGCLEFGGWNHDEKALTPIRVTELLAMPHKPALFWVLGSLAAAAEAGGDRWLNDRHHNALKKLGDAEFDLMTYVGITGLFDPAE